MLRIVAAVSTIVLAGVMVPALGKGAPGPAQVTGTVTYRQRSALPPNASLQVQLTDVSRQDVAATAVATATMLTGTKQVPLPFVLAYQDTALDQTHAYTIRASISIDNKEAFITTSAYPVITKGAPTHVDIVLEPVVATIMTAPTTLEGRTWKLVALGGSAPVRERDATLEFNEARIAGTGGCNRIVGSFRTDGSSLSIEPGGMTRMACPEPLMSQDQRLIDALRATDAYRIEGDTLVLTAGDRVLAQFRAENASASK